jgi:hypothetical protein
MRMKETREGGKEGSNLSHNQPHHLRIGPQEVFEKSWYWSGKLFEGL